MKTPNWAQDLILDASLYLQSIGYKAELPDIHWRNAPRGRWLGVKRKTSSGICYAKHITIVAGRDHMDCKLTILHELAHWALPTTDRIGHEAHTPHFWNIAWQLYREFKLPIRYCKEREGNYMKGALVAYRKSTRR